MPHDESKPRFTVIRGAINALQRRPLASALRGSPAGDSSRSLITVDVLRSAAAGEEKALGVLIDFIHSRAKLALRAGAPGLEDAAQNALIKVLDAVRTDRFRPDHASPPSAYVNRIVINEVKNEYRSRDRYVFDEALEEVEDTVAFPLDEILDVNEKIAILRHAYDNLPPEPREVLYLRFLEEYSVEETARVLNVPVGTVKSRTSRALTQLREQCEVLASRRRDGRA